MMKRLPVLFSAIFALALISVPLVSVGQSPAESQGGPTSDADEGGPPEEGAAPDAADEAPSESDDDDGQPSDGSSSDEDDVEPVADSSEDGDESDGEDVDPESADSSEESVDEASLDGIESDEMEPDEEFESDEEMGLDDDSGFGDSPIADLASDDFEPLEDIEEGVLDQIIPASVHPRLEWSGTFRVRSTAAMNWDLGTSGTSAILPPLGSVAAAASPNQDNQPLADPEKNTQWSTNMRLRLDPTLHISEMLRVHVELDVLNNVVFGSLPASTYGLDRTRPYPGDPLLSSNQRSPNERAWYDDAIQFNEVYGVARSVFGEFRAGRMDDHWGLGMWMNDGDCEDCDFGNNIDRLMLRTGGPAFFGLYATVAMDFPEEGLTSKSLRQGSQPYDLAQIDDADQWTFSIQKAPLSREGEEIQRRELLENKSVVTNGGLLYRHRNQAGEFVREGLGAGEPVDPSALPALRYIGTSLHVFDLWAQFLWQPSLDTSIRIELEGLLGFGSVDNPTDEFVGGSTPEDLDAINCFDEGVRDSNPNRCTSSQQDISQYGLALESEFKFGGPVSFGVNGGFASGGSTSNWGADGNDFDFFRFNPDYHVDLILFRNVIGSVTNAVYYNPYVSAAFLDNDKLRLDFDAILSHAWDKEGTPNGDSPWLGLEFDAAVRYIHLEMFHAALEGGILFPFGGLDGREGEPKLTPVNGPLFDENTSAGVAWTVQFKFFWKF